VKTQTVDQESLLLEELSLKKSALVIRAINHKLRQQIIKLIHSQRRMTVTEIYIKLRLEQSVVSQHLAILRKAGYVTTSRQGKFIFYSVRYERLDQIHQVIGELLK
jgi:DNA-binding transcriptional ArsR family regulator